jgi:hypothetical protein
LGGIGAADNISIFIGLDDDAEDAGSMSTAEDKLTITFKVFPTPNKEKVFSHSGGDWSVMIHYTLMK